MPGNRADAGGFLRRILGQGKEDEVPGPPEAGSLDVGAVKDLERRVRGVAESLLENEALTADLDDTAAQESLAWALALGKEIARSTAGMDDTTAEEAMYPRLRAVRRLMRYVNRWVAYQSEMTAEDRADLLHKLVDQAAVAHGGAPALPHAQRCEAFLVHYAALGHDPQQFIVDLRRLIEEPDMDADTPSSGPDVLTAAKDETP